MRVLLGSLALLAAACGGGSGGDDGGDPPPGGDPYAVVTNTGLPVAGGFADAAVLDPFVAVPVSEFEAGADLNADGDQLDRVLHVVDAATGLLTNLGLAVAGPIHASDRRFAFLVSEPDQAGLDRNGDGDAADAVWAVYQPAAIQPAVVNLGLATPFTGLAGAGTRGGFVLLQSEAASGGADLNGDADAADVVVRTFDGVTGAVTAQVLGPRAAATPLVARNGRVLFAMAEAALGPAGTDLNGDGDFTDTVLGAVDFAAGFPAFVTIGRAVETHPYVLTDGAAAYLIDEAADAAADLNGDGDATDAVVAIFDFAGGTFESLPFSGAIPQLALAADPLRGIVAGRTRILVAISEAANGRDLNLDTDLADAVVGWVDTQNAAGTMQVLPAATLGALQGRLDGVRGLVAISERAQGAIQGTDLNGDGDDTDEVAFAIDTSSAPGTLTNLGVAAQTFHLVGDDALVGVSEQAQGNGDRNGDADTDDVVLTYFDVLRLTSRGLGIVTADASFFRLSAQELRIATFLAEGQSPNFDDLNGDGDTDDTGLTLITLNPALIPPGLIAPTPFFAEIAASAGAPPLSCGQQAFFFPTAEADAGADLNGDGDEIDTVLQYVTYTDD